ncbi:hypothetical protein ACFCYI_20290 [Streptomyces sp. NPDC056257]|uniref:hypothetical protein n=1 Tax=Streptomyces sp. NPDC056257 TaxID=3345765 RepID=UPI0035DB7D15
MTPQWRRLAGSLCLVTALTGCTDAGPASERPASRTVLGRRNVAVIGQGAMQGTSWRVDLVSADGKLCTQATVGGNPAGSGCEPPVSKEIPVNIALDGLNSSVLLVYGAADPSVTRLVARSTAGETQAIDITAHEGKSFFAYASKPGTAEDLMAFDSGGQQVFSAAEKIREFQTPAG